MSSPSRPVMTFQVGVSGHRHLPEADVQGIAAAASDLFRDLRTKTLALHASDQARARPLYAPDPPRLRCVSGFAEGADTILATAALAEGWELTAVLPFSPAEFAADFAGDALARYRSLFDRAAETCALDGARGDATVYASVGQVIIEQSDLLLVVWDGRQAAGPGGTGDVAAAALGRGLPVGILSPVGASCLSWQDASGGDCEVILRTALFPAAADLALAQSYFTDRPPGTQLAALALRTYERWLLVGYRAPAVAPGPRSPAAAAALEQAFHAADQLAAQHAARYRAAGLMRYGLILPATLAGFVGWYGPGMLQAIGNLAQFGILLFLLRFSAKGWWEPSHRGFVAYRAIAEYLRNARMLAALGAVASVPGAAAHQEKSTDWTAWYCRAATRELGLVSAGFDPETIELSRASVRAEALAQIAYLLGRAARFDVMASRLRQIGVTLSVCGVVFSGIRACLLLAHAKLSALRAFNELAFVLPAMAPVFLGLLSFNEYGKLATRYRAVASELQTLVALLDAAPPRRPAVLSIARRIAEVMLAEGADWQLLVRARTVSAY